MILLKILNVLLGLRQITGKKPILISMEVHGTLLNKFLQCFAQSRQA